MTSTSLDIDPSHLQEAFSVGLVNKEMPVDGERKCIYKKS